MSGSEHRYWESAYQEAKRYFTACDYSCFDERPLNQQSLEYTAGDVDVIEKLYDVYLPDMSLPPQ